MKKGLCIFLILGLLTGCNAPAAQPDPPQAQQNNPLQMQTGGPQINPDDLFSQRDYRVDYEKHTTITLSGNSAGCPSNAVQISGNTVTITDEGTYIITGKLDNGMIIVDAEKSDKTQIVLQNAHITNTTGAPLYIRQADKVFVTLWENTENTLVAGETFTQPDDTNIDGTIFSKEDLTFNGTGKLTVSAPAGHGIVCKDSLHFTGGQYSITSANHGISGKDELCIDGGSYIITAGKDGLHSENKDDPDSGYLYIKNGNFHITAEGDGISAASWLRTDAGTYQILTGGGSKNGSQQSSPNWGHFEGGKGDFVKPGRPGGSQRPQGMTPPQGQQEQPPTHITTPQAPQTGAPTPPQTQTPAAPDTADSISMKGMKAGTWLTIAGGDFTLNTADDGLHSNGSADIFAGRLQLDSGDDAIHAEQVLTMTDGTISIRESYEGLEALHLKIYGGNIQLTASDDGLNAAGGNDESGFGGRDQWGGGKGGKGGFGGGNGSILIAGGQLHITASGDAFDANGTLEITGGKTILCGPTRGDTAVLDYDRSGTISGGEFLGTGGAGMAQTLTGTNQGVLSLKMINQPANTQITITDSSGNVLCSHVPALDFALIIFSSPKLKKGETYTVSIGTASQQMQVTAN